MTVTTPPRPPHSMPPTAVPPGDPRDTEIEPDALIEEARRRARRRRRLYAACVLLAAAAGTGAYLGFGHDGGNSAEAPPAAEKPLVRIHAGSAASKMSNGPLLITAFEADSRGVGPPGWYGLSKIELGGLLSPVARCPESTRWCGEVESIDWSPDGKLLALSVTSFASANPYNGLHVVNPATGTDQQILNCSPPECDWFDLDWSPDGSRLAFVSGAGTKNEEIYLINADGTGRNVLKTVDRASSPSWSPNGKWIAYAGFDENGSAVYAIRVDGSQGRLLARHGSGPAWSPDGTKIAYRTNCGVKLISPSGTDMTPPSPRRCNAIGILGFGPPVWSPDGRQIAISGKSSMPGGTTKRGTYVMNADGSNLARLTGQWETVHIGAQPRPAWQPVRRPPTR